MIFIQQRNGHAIKSTARHFVAKHIHKSYTLDIFTWIVWNMSFLNFIHKQCYYVAINRISVLFYLFILNSIISIVTRSCIIHKQIKKFRWALSCAYAKFVFNFELYSYQTKMKWKCLNFKQSYHQKRREKLTNKKVLFVWSWLSMFLQLY